MEHAHLLIFPVILLGIVGVLVLSQRSLKATGIILVISIAVGTYFMMKNSFNPEIKRNWLTVFYMVNGSVAIAAVINLITNDFQKPKSMN